MTLDTLCKLYIACLTKNQAVVFCFSFGLNKRGETKTLTELAEYSGCSINSVRGHLEAALNKLKLPLFKPLVEGLKTND